VRYGPEPFQYEPYEDVHCANCGMRGHRLRTCMGPLVNGFIRGCPRCNDVTHSYQNCPVKRNPIDVANLLIHSRMNRPPIQSTVDYKSLEGFSTTAHRPWTIEYAIRNSQAYLSHIYRVNPEMEDSNRDPQWDNGSHILPQVDHVGAMPWRLRPRSDTILPGAMRLPPLSPPPLYKKFDAASR
jgi:hypothetical protein